MGVAWARVIVAWTGMVALEIKNKLKKKDRSIYNLEVYLLMD